LCEGNDAGPYTEQRAAYLFQMMLQALQYVHMKGVVHADLKLENFVFESKKRQQLKLIDFGLSKRWAKDSRPDNTVVGTAYYVAPEVLAKKNKAYSSACDMWAMGVILFMMLSGTPPFNGRDDRQICNAIKSGKFRFGPEWGPTEDFPGVSDEAKDLVRKLLVKDPSKRMNAKAALEHDWFKVAPKRTAKLNPSITSSLMTFHEKGDLKKMAVDMIAFSMTPKQIKELRDQFKAMDTDNSGEISKDELAKALSLCKDTMDENITKMFDAINQDKSTELISYSEFCAAAIAKNHYMAEERVADAFAKLDTNNDGHISKEDLKKKLQGLYCDEKLTQMIEEGDRTKDGFIDYDEFIALMDSEDSAAQDALRAEAEEGKLTDVK